MKIRKSLLVVLLALAVLLASCSGDTTGAPNGKATANPNDSSKGPELYETRFAEGVTISIGCVDNYLTGYSFTQGLPVWEHLEEQTGITIDWQVTPSSDYATVMQTRLAAGVDLPDFVRVPGNAMKYVSDGIFVSIDDWIKDWGYYTTAFYNENPYVKPFVTAPDGKIYFFTSDVAGTSLSDPYVYMIREDWLKKVGMEAPVTLDDWYKVWKAFLEQDANGNGEADEIPWCNDNTIIGVTCFGSAYGLYTHVSSGWNPSGDKVTYDWIKPEAKEFLTWLNKCYLEGLLDKEFSTQTYDTMLKKVTNNQSGGLMRFLNGLSTNNKALEGAGIGGKYIVVDPPVLKEGDKPFVERYGPVSGLHGFTKDCTENQEQKFKFIDYLYGSQDGAWSFAFGIEGKSYEIKDGIPVFTDFVLDNPDGLDFNAALRSIGAMGTLPWARSLNGLWSYQALATLEGKPDMQAAAAKYSESYIVDSFPGSILLTDDEQSVISQYEVDIVTYTDEMIVKFITGQTSLDQFDTFVTDLKNLGLEEVLAVKQAQLDRYKANK